MSTTNSTEQQPQPRYFPLGQLVMARLKEFYREPEAIFWVYGFPILMVVALGIAFRNQPIEQINVDIQVHELAEKASSALASAGSANQKFQVEILSEEECRRRLRVAKTDLIVVPTEPIEEEEPQVGESLQMFGPLSLVNYEYVFDPTRPESLLARNKVDDVLQRAAGRKDPVETSDQIFDEPGGRYIDFLVPGLLGMSLMGGGLWGVGFVTVDLRIRKLLKRFLATPMRKSQFLAGIMISRLIFMVPEVLILLLFAHFAFDVKNQGSIFAVVFFILLGAFTFAGIGLLVASRAKTLESVSGLMNLVMLPMWILSGIFFSSERFPEAVQPIINVIPLTPLNNALRAVMLEGAGIASQLPEIGLLIGWGVVSFVLALSWFRWN